MNCRQMETLLPAYLDGEAHGLLNASIVQHLAGCAACRTRQDTVAELRLRIREEVPYYPAPAALRARLVAEVARSSATPKMPSRNHRWRWLTGGALGGALATLLAWSVGSAIVTAQAAGDIAVAAVTRHVAATLDDREIEVASSDRHTVKPWLSARLDYSPPVRDLADEGFPLVGGRLDRMGDETVAVLVYGYGQHVVDVYVWPTQSSDALPEARVVRGFNVVPARSASMTWLAVSDAEAAAVSELVHRLCREDTEHPQAGE